MKNKLNSVKLNSIKKWMNTPLRYGFRQIFFLQSGYALLSEENFISIRYHLW